MPAHPAASLKRIALIGNCVPRQCGIATFTHDLGVALAQEAPRTEVFIVPVNDVSEGYDYPSDVWFEIVEKKLDSYLQAADFLNLNDVDAVSVQHEFGIFGGPAGRHVLSLLRNLNMPIVTTLHTILREPTEEQREVMEGLIEVTDRFTPLSKRGSEFLREVYGVPEKQITVIPHGIPSMPFLDSSFYKDKFGVVGRDVLLTFGLLGPGKGIEQAIEAMPGIIARHPQALYLIVGATHPNLLRHEGEAYRISLQQKARQLGVDEHINFHNRYVTDTELAEFIGAADIYLTPYPNVAQICSGTLARAVGAGKAVVSTPYWHAEELLADGRGALVPVGDPEAMATAVNRLLENQVERDAMRKRAYLFGQSMSWENVAHSYLETFQACRAAPRGRPQSVRAHRGETLPLINLKHLKRMTDDTGMLQHSIYAVPLYSEGYTTDDNARALILALLVRDLINGFDDQLSELASKYMSFLLYAFNPKQNRFRNFMAYDGRRWLEDVGSEDSHGRALWAIGTLAERCTRTSTREWAIRQFEAALPVVKDFTSPRAWAFSMLGITEYLKRLPGDRIAQRMLREFGDRLVSLFRACATDSWPWFENYLTYCNAKLPHALLATSIVLDDAEMRDVGLESLRWLCDMQTAEEGHFRPIGSEGFYVKGGHRAVFDQQPIEAHATLSAAIAAHGITDDPSWVVEARRAFDWFLGANDVGRPMFDPSTGGCHDGVEPTGVNANQGAESTLAFLLARVEIRQIASGSLWAGVVPSDASEAAGIAATLR